MGINKSTMERQTVAVREGLGRGWFGRADQKSIRLRNGSKSRGALKYSLIPDGEDLVLETQRIAGKGSVGAGFGPFSAKVGAKAEWMWRQRGERNPPQLGVIPNNGARKGTCVSVRKRQKMFVTVWHEKKNGSHDLLFIRRIQGGEKLTVLDRHINNPYMQDMKGPKCCWEGLASVMNEEDLHWQSDHRQRDIESDSDFDDSDDGAPPNTIVAPVLGRGTPIQFRNNPAIQGLA